MSQVQAKAAPVATLKVNVEAPAAVKALTRESARSRTIRMAVEFNGKPVSEFQAAWTKAAAAQKIHHETSVFTLGKSKRNKPHEEFSGWLSWLVRNGIVVVVQPK